MRSDARRNRELILRAAVDLFTEHGPAVSMEEIARAAGLGVGTLYRHFPDRQNLLEEIAADSLRHLNDRAQHLLDTTSSGWETLTGIVEQCVDLPLALVKSLSETPLDKPELGALADHSDTLIAQAVDRAQRQHTVRDDLTPTQIVNMLSVVVCRPGIRPHDPLITVVLDGLRHPVTTSAAQPRPATIHEREVAASPEEAKTQKGSPPHHGAPDQMTSRTQPLAVQARSGAGRPSRPAVCCSTCVVPGWSGCGEPPTRAEPTSPARAKPQ